MNLERRQRPEPLEHGVLLEPDEPLPLHALVEKVLLLERQPLPCRELGFRRPLYRAVESGDVDLAILTLDSCQQASELFVRVRRCAAVFT